MSPELLLQKFGYLAVLVGTFLEGETILVLAGFFAERGYLRLPLVIVCAFSGAYVGHVFWFWLGRSQGVKLLDRFHELLTTDTPVSNELGKLVVFCGVRDYPARVKCATLAWHTLKSALDQAGTASTEGPQAPGD